MEYNTSRGLMSMREYGRHVHSMVAHLLTIEDRERRTQQAKVVIELMGFLNPHIKNIEDYQQKLWDHLFFMSDFKLEVDGPYPMPDRATYRAKPEPLHYPRRKPRYNHLGKNLELVIDKAMQEEDPEKKSGFAHTIAYYMKLAYNNWHKELVHDENIRAELNAITGGALEFTNTPYVKQYRTNDTGSNRNYGGRNNRNKFQPRSGGPNRNNQGGNRNQGSGNGPNRNQKYKKRF